VAEITDLLNRWSSGDSQAFDELVPIVYAELKRIAAHALRSEDHLITLDCTALVHEAYLRLVDQTRMQWNGRAHFFGAAANVMRRVLVEDARRRLTNRRGKGAAHLPLDEAMVAVLAAPDLNVIALNLALEHLERSDAESARVVELRCFGGLSIEETAEIMGISPSSVTRSWAFARAWLYRRLGSTANPA
jgi:RNA polymerase sigma factor (TIGR02999 family)